VSLRVWSFGLVALLISDWVGGLDLDLAVGF